MDNGIVKALRTIGRELPRWWEETNATRYEDVPNKGGVLTAPYKGASTRQQALDVTPGDLLETGASFINVPLTLATYSPDVEGAPKLGGAKAGGVAGKVYEALRRRSEGPRGLNSVREAISSADAARKEARTAGYTGSLVNKPEPLKLLPQTPDQPYIDTPQFLPPRQPVRTKGGEAQYNPRTADLLQSRAARSAINRNIDRGDIIGMRDWYGTRALYDAAMNEGLTPEEFSRMMQHLASASQRSPVPGQIKRGSATWVADRQGLLTPDAPPFEFAPGYGSLAQKDIIKRAYEIAAGQGLDPTAKLGRFYQNLMGNLDPVTVDVMAMRGPVLATKDPRWLATNVRSEKPSGEIDIIKPREMFESGELTLKDALRRPGVWEAAPKGAEYNAFEDLYRDVARKRGMAPAQAQASAWYGSGTEAGLRTAPRTFEQAIEDRVFHTAQQRGETPQRVLSQFLRGERELGRASVPAMVGTATAAAGGAGGVQAYKSIKEGQRERERRLREQDQAAQGGE